MPPTLRLLGCSAIASLALVFACGSDDASKHDPAAEFPCDVDVAIRAKCAFCHSSNPPPGFRPPFHFTTYADTQATTRLTISGKPLPIYQAMGEQIRAGGMPLSRETKTPAPLPIDSPERAVILKWVDDGAPARAPGTSCP